MKPATVRPHVRPRKRSSAGRPRAGVFPALAAALLGISAACWDAAAAEESGSGQWRLLLEQQLQTEKKCKFRAFITVREFELGGEQKVEGRVACTDGREFTFTRAHRHQKFEIKLCEPAYC